jgi:predicted DNA-binding protein with PD1-like motif
MQSKLLADDVEKTYALIFDKGDEVISTLKSFAAEHKLTAAHFTAIGAFREATLGYFDRDRRDYKKIPVHEQVEVLSLIGDVAAKDGKPEIHAHVVVGTSEGAARGGHILEATVWPTLEVILTETPKYLRRVHDDETGLALIDLEASTRRSKTPVA